ncbi:MAG: N-acetyltransferase [Acidobacteria bacterium]|nr:N-acetyltransferase [Acidobacteriota bacterium]
MQLETNHLILRDCVEDDWLRVREYRSEVSYLRYHTEETSSEERAREFVRMVTDWAAEQPRQKFQLATTRASDGVLIGSCGVRIASPEDREAEFGCELDPREWGNGLGAEASRAIIDYGFRMLGMHRIWAHTIGDNLAAVKLAERMGMRQEGRLRESRFFKGRWWDRVIYSVLEQDWHP